MSVTRILGQVVGVPTLNRYDRLSNLLQSLVNSSTWPEKLIIVDNGRKLGKLGEMPFPVEVITPDYNIGVAASWNCIGRLSRGNTVLVNDDFTLAGDALGRLDKMTEPISHNEATRYSCFHVTQEFWQKVGEFDEGFWPGNYEDTDIEVRAKRLGIPINIFADSLGDHTDGKASQRHGDYTYLFDRNQRRFNAKWLNQKEAWGGNKPDELEWTFSDYRQHSPDSGMFFDVLRRLANQNQKVVEFGTGSGHTGIAFIAGKPKEFVSYDLVSRPGTQLIYHLRGQTSVRIEIGNVLEIEPIEADLLFVDDLHTADNVFIELSRHAKGVRRGILLHDIVAWGETGEDGKPGIIYGIKRFLEEHLEWCVGEEDRQWPGLMLLRRS